MQATRCSKPMPESRAQYNRPANRSVAASLLPLLFSCFMAPIATAQPASQPPVESGAAAGHLLLYDFFSYNTMESKMVRDLIINSGTASDIIKENYQLVPVEQGKDPEKESLYKIIHYPTLVIAQPDGTEIDRVIGFHRPSEVAAMLKAAINGHSEITRLKERAAAPDASIIDHMQLADAQLQRGKQEALFHEYLWILDNGERIDPSLYPAAFRMVVRQLVSLGREYLPAKEEVERRMTAVESAAMVDDAPQGALERAFAMNDAVGQSSRNVPLYLKIPAGSPLKQSLFPGVFPALVRAGKYKEAAAVADLGKIVDSMYPRARGMSATPAARERLTIYASAACEALVALRQVDKAKRVAGSALDYLAEDNRALLTRLAGIASQPDANAGDFLAWLKSYSQANSQQPSGLAKHD